MLLYLGTMKNYQRHVWAVGLYALVAVLMTWPVVANLTTQVAGQGGDPYQTLWRFEEKLRTFDWGTEFFGQGPPRLVNLSVWPWIWAHVMFGEPLGYNVVWLVSFMLAGFSMYLLAGELFGRFGAAAGLAGLMYMLLPFHVAHALGHFGAMQMQWIPLIIWSLRRWYKSDDIRWGTLTGLLAVVQAWSEHHYWLWLAILGGLAWLYFRRLPKQWLGVTVIAGLLIGLSYWPTVRLALQPGNSLELGVQQTERFSADLMSYITPAWAPALMSWRFGGNISEATHFLGWMPLLLIVFFHQRIPKQQWKFWLLVTIVFGLISLGPRLFIGGHATWIPLPYALVHWLPGMAAVRAVGRAGVLVMVAVSVLFGWVVQTQVRRPRTLLVLTAWLLLEFLFFPVPMESARLSTTYDLVRTLPGRQVLELPAATNYTAASRALWAMHAHGKSVVGNIALERGEDPAAQAASQTLPGVKQLLYLRTTDLRENRAEFFGQDIAESLPDALRWLEVGAVIIHADSMTDLQLGAVRVLLENKLGWAVRSFGDVLLYPVPAAGGDGIVIRRGEGWEAITYDKEKNITLAAYRDQAEVVLINVSEQTKRVRLSDDHGLAAIVTVPPGETIYTFSSPNERVVLTNPRYAVIAD